MLEVESGRLLVATPATQDPNFRRTVVFLLEHSFGGSLGVVLNRPTGIAVAYTLPRWADVMTPPAVLFSGGPVEPQSALCLGRCHPRVDPTSLTGWRPVRPPLGTVDLDGDPREIASGMVQMRLFAGYAGWAPGQLEGEIHAGGWFVLAANVDDPIAPDAEDLWHDVLERQPGSLAWVANFPPDPALN